MRKGAGGAPAKHDWDHFWIEVAYWTGLNGLEEAHRPALQKHMEEWTARNMDPAPVPQTIRNKIRKLYNRVRV